MSDMSNYQEQLARQAMVVKWGRVVTEHDLLNIQSDIEQAINSGKTIKVGDLQGIIARRVPNTQFMFFGSVDNSDLNTALRQIAPKKK
ncbi:MULTISPECIES: hypothetical protein [Citrobacter freundii complex]|uniref:hypothetical protein n=1 Tax=Citrobacter freundii complex TaxID=1344959 RepID=UPI0012F2AC5B|nr:hypothetical protein [Citrobacter werkmanii]EBM5664772.1 hypothetical protein [Salmonella enterica]EGN2315237.1 hypothetical protein [Escherichia coli]EGT0655834.1 hypothetical protein [Citrobacter freundii]HCS9547024.1 hypothetical protein [Salmonella enterica subsp. diarizonae serovar 61:r:z53]HEC1252171.1 hypothetical protein [Citrobacter braakii]HEC6739058.1 hypothetical protein [Salmonella enterica subsp. enterica serovar Thompson]